MICQELQYHSHIRNGLRIYLYLHLYLHIFVYIYVLVKRSEMEEMNLLRIKNKWPVKG